MESEQKPKEIKIEFTCEVKEKPLSPKLQKRKKKADVAETFFSFIVLILSILLPYIVVSTHDWSDAQYTLFLYYWACCAFLSARCVYAILYIKNLRLRRKEETTSSPRIISFEAI